jgi:hypothetical protein
MVQRVSTTRSGGNVELHRGLRRLAEMVSLKFLNLDVVLLLELEWHVPEVLGLLLVLGSVGPRVTHARRQDGDGHRGDSRADREAVERAGRKRERW